MEDTQKNVYILGSRGLPAAYGGFETFVDHLTKGRKDPRIKYFVSCQKYPDEYKTIQGREYEYNGALCFPVKVPHIGSAKSVLCDMLSLKWAIRHIRKNKVQDPVIFICTCRIGPYISLKKHTLKKLGVKLVINPDGHEWMRAKWNRLIKRYWKYSERHCIRNADFVICDSRNIEKYIRELYAAYEPKTTFIAYGSETSPSPLRDDEGPMADWLERMGVKPGEYYLNIGRLVPENNYETILREFMKSSTHRKLVIVTNLKNNKYYEELKERLNLSGDERICFSPAIYDHDLIQKIKDDAYAYIHGHSVGGTNPSLLEALSTVDVNLLYDCGFNREVGEDTALYWSLEDGGLASLIGEADRMDTNKRRSLGDAAHERIRLYYTWDEICRKYEEVFLGM